MKIRINDLVVIYNVLKDKKLNKLTVDKLYDMIDFLTTSKKHVEDFDSKMDQIKKSIIGEDHNEKIMKMQSHEEGKVLLTQDEYAELQQYLYSIQKLFSDKVNALSEEEIEIEIPNLSKEDFKSLIETIDVNMEILIFLKKYLNRED